MRALKTYLRNPVLIACTVVWALSFVLYIISAPTGPSGVADADEFLSVANAGGVAHSPGYPLYTTLLEIFLKLPIPASFPQKAAFLSSILQACAGIFVFLIAKEVADKLIKKRKALRALQTHELVLLIIGTLLVQTNLLVWQYATLSEVFALTNFFFASSAYLWLKATFSLQKKHVLLAAFVWGLGVAHHYLLLGLFPLVVVIIISTWIKRVKIFESAKFWGLLLVIFSCGFGFSQALLWWRLSRQALVSWVFAPTLHGWWQFISRGLYSGILADGSRSRGLFSPIILSDALSALREYVAVFIPTHVGIIPIVLACVCIAWLLRRRQSLWVYGLLTSTLLMTIGVVLLLAVPSSSDSIQRLELLTLVERMYLPGYLLLGIFAPLGLIIGSRWIREKFKQMPSFAIVLIALLVLSVTVALNGQEFTHLKSGYPGPLQIGMRLSNLPQDSVVLCFSDLTCFTTMYYLSVEKLRPDIQLVPVSEQLRFARGPNHVVVRYPDNPLRLSYVVAESLAKGNPVFVSQITPLYDQIWNLNHTFALDSTPVFKEIKCDIEEDGPKNVPLIIYPEKAPPRTKLSSVIYQRSFVNSEAGGYHGALDCPQSSKLAQQAMECSSYACQLNLGLLTTMLDPHNSNYRSMLAGFYEMQQFLPLAIREYQVAYTLDPANATAAAALTRLDQSMAYPVNLEGL